MDVAIQKVGSGIGPQGDPESASEFVVSGDRARDLRIWAEARRNYEQAVSLDPALAHIWVQLGHASKEMGDHAAAEEAYRRALELAPDDADGYLQLGHLMKLIGRIADAETYYNQALALSPDMNEAAREMQALQTHRKAQELLDTANGALTDSDWERARAGYQDVLRINVASDDAWLGLAKASLGAGNASAAEAAFRKVLELNPEHAQATLQLARLLKASGRFPDAVALYTRAIALHAGDEAEAELAAAQRQLEIFETIAEGDRSRDIGDWESARDRYEEVLGLDPKVGPTWIQLGHAHKQLGDLDRAEEAYRRALELAPDDADGYLQLGHLMKLAARRSDAELFYQQALDRDPGLKNAQLELDRLRQSEQMERRRTVQELQSRGDQARDAGDWENARLNYEEALRLDPSVARTWIQLGHAHKELRDLVRAEEAYRKALHLNSQDADGYLQLGHLVKLVGRTGDAGALYAHALALDPSMKDARMELEAIHNSNPVYGRGARTQGWVSPAKARSSDSPDGVSIAFEVSDLMAYFKGARLPTGIQRVQLEVIHAVSMDETGLDYSIVCFNPDRGFWVEIPKSLFARFYQSATISADHLEEDWQALLAALEATMRDAPLFAFPDRCILLDLGTSWWQRNYFLNLRLAKSANRVRYVPFIHDLIPVMTPEYCAADLRRDFIVWIIGVLHHADHFFANSQSTKNDLLTVARELGHELPDAKVVPLSADFRRAVGSISHAASDDSRYFLETHHLAKGGYVLCVATIEARKNHAAAFAVWLRLIKKFGARNVPKLVCVGKDGWLNDNVYEMLRSSEILSHQVVVLHNVSDAALATLYENCLFTLYPSFYEGWGLPVTEALCYGKVPVVANISSLPEAGGDFAEYFEIGSENELLTKVERLIRDGNYRAEKERKIAEEFQPTSWQEITEAIVGQMKEWWSASTAGDTPASGTAPAKATTGMLHSLARSTESILWKGLESGEVYRNGRAWWSLEDWGCWTKGTHPAQLSFTVSGVNNAELLVYLAMRGAPVPGAVCTLRSDGLAPLDVELGPEQDKVVVLELDAAPNEDRQVTISISTNVSANLALLSGGADKRVLGPGVRWFYVCRKDDLLARVSMAEALAIGDPRRLTRKAPRQPDFFLHT